MKKMIVILSLVFASNIIAAQTYKVNAAGDIVKSDKKETTKVDSVYQVKDSTTFYVGSRGGIYYWKTSKNTGKKYKVYLKKED